MGVGGYVVLAPSTHRSGDAYRWHSNPDLPLPEAPAALLEAVRRGRIHRRSASPAPVLDDVDDDDTDDDDGPFRWDRFLDRLHAGKIGGWSPAGLLRTMEAAVEGERNAILFWAACRVGENVRERRVREFVALETLERLAAAAEGIGLTASEVEATVQSGYRRGQDEED